MQPRVRVAQLMQTAQIGWLIGRPKLSTQNSLKSNC
jgi:hypothetical protein